MSDITFDTKNSKLIIKNSAGNPVLMHPETVAEQVLYSSSYSDSTTVKQELDRLGGLFGSADAMVFKGVVNNTTGLPTSNFTAGWTYKVAEAGTYAGQNCEIGDLIVAVSDSAWAVIQSNIDGAVSNTDYSISGASADTDKVAVFSNGSGSVLTGQASRTIAQLSTDHVYTVATNAGLTLGTATDNRTGSSPEAVTSNAYGQVSTPISVDFAQVEHKLIVDTDTSTDSNLITLSSDTSNNVTVTKISLAHNDVIKTINVDNSESITVDSTDTIAINGNSGINVDKAVSGNGIVVSANVFGDDGSIGLVPASSSVASGDKAKKFLRADSEWAFPATKAYTADSGAGVVITENTTAGVVEGVTSYKVAHQSGYTAANSAKSDSPVISGTSATTGFYKFNVDTFGHINGVTDVAKADIDNLVSYWGTITCDGTSNNTIAPSGGESGLTINGTSGNVSVVVSSGKIVVDRTIDCVQVASLDDVPSNLRDGGLIFLTDETV